MSRLWFVWIIDFLCVTVLIATTIMGRCHYLLRSMRPLRLKKQSIKSVKQIDKSAVKSEYVLNIIAFFNLAAKIAKDAKNRRKK